MNTNPLLSLFESLLPYDPIDLLTAVAGLQLMPENAERAIRLEALSHVVAALPDEGSKPRISSGRIKMICQSSVLDSFAWAEDPVRDPFTEAFTFHGGSFVVFPGLSEQQTFILRRMAESLFRIPARSSLEQRFINKSHTILSGVLAISNEVARRAGVERGTEPASIHSGGIVVPPSEYFHRLKHAVSFSQSEISDLLGKYSVRPSALEELTIAQGKHSTIDYQVGGGPLQAKPIVLATQQWIIALPGCLLSAARHGLIKTALEFGIRENLSERFSTSVWETVITCLEFMGIRELAIQLPDPLDDEGSREGLFEIDSDKLLHVLLFTDPLNEYDASEPFGQWPNADELMQRVDDRLDAVERHILAWARSPNEIMFLVLFQGVGRTFAAGFNRPKEPVSSLFLAMAAADLEVIALLEGRDPLVLWKYARARERLSANTKVLSFDELDIFEVYRKLGHNFYQSDDTRPNAIWIQPGGGGELRREVLRKRDWHAAWSHEPDYFTEVTTLYDTRSAPVYAKKSIMRRSRPDRPALLVEGLPIPVWVLGPSLGDKSDRKHYDITFNLVDTIAYWLWQFTPTLAPIIADIPRHCPLALEVSLAGDWSSDTQSSGDSQGVPIEVHADLTRNALLVSLSPFADKLLSGPDNHGERELMREVIRGLRLLLPEKRRGALSDSFIDRGVDLHAPLGQKKKLLSVDRRLSPTLDNHGLPSFRKVQEANENELLDELGDHLVKNKGYREGSIAHETANKTFNNAVIFFFNQLELLVSSLKPDGILEQLIARHESIVREVSFTRFTIPTRIACFSNMPEMVDQLSKEFPERFKAAMAARFVIEYVVARPPQGIRPMSLDIYDRLQSLASEIINFGKQSDLVQFGLADLKCSILPSGRLGTDRIRFEQARDAFSPVQAAGEIARSMRDFEQHWRDITKPPVRPKPVEEMDDAARDEFGVTLTELVELLGESTSIGFEVGPVVACLPLDDLTSRLTANLGWSAETTIHALGLLSLIPRPLFLIPPPPHRREDVYPWLFNRSLSYLRRPFLHREREGKVEILWGPRHTYNTFEYIIMLCTDGRLRAQSIKMKQAMGRLLNEHGKLFNDRVADFFAADSRLIVRRRVKKIPSLRGQLEQIGDIDVLIVDSRKRRVTVVECKDLAGARTPHEMGGELRAFFYDSDGKMSILAKHLRRVEWIKLNLNQVLDFLQVEHRGKWRVDSLIVVDQELFTPFLKKSPVPIIPFDQLASLGYPRPR